MYVGSLHKDNTINVMKDYVSKCGFSVSYITKVTPDDKHYNSYHIMMKKKDYITVMKDNRGIACIPYYPPKRLAMKLGVINMSQVYCMMVMTR